MTMAMPLAALPATDDATEQAENVSTEKRAEREESHPVPIESAHLSDSSFVTSDNCDNYDWLASRRGDGGTAYA